MELDHIFIRATKGAPEGDVLLDFGLVEGSKNTHPGQGTANRRFFFHNMMIELLWVEDYIEVNNERTAPLKLFERLSDTNKEVSPYGICFRPSSNSKADVIFPAWEYKPVYLPNELSIKVGYETPLDEPMWFYTSFACRQDEFSSDKMEPINHKMSLKEVTSTIVHMNKNSEISQTVMIKKDLPSFQVIEAEDHLLELEFDNGIKDKSYDFRPLIPLILRW